MSNNTTLPGTGDVIADEDVGGVKYQRVKLVDGSIGGTTPAKVSLEGELSVSVDDLSAAFTKALGNVITEMATDPATGRLRVTVDNIAGALTLGTITTVSNITTLPTLGQCTLVPTVTTVNQIGAVPANSTVLDLMEAAWAQCVRGRIS